jgi:hypothetical protein
MRGDLGETAATRALTRAGYELLPSRLPGNRGFDHVAVRRGTDGTIEDLLIVESKYSISGRSRLGMKRSGQQMSRPWIERNLELMGEHSALTPTANLIERYMESNTLRLKVNTFQPVGGRAFNRWTTLAL